MEEEERLGDRVRRLRLAKNLRPEVLAAALDVSLQTIRNLERNKGIRAERLVPLARLLGVTTDYLLGMSEHPTPCSRDDEHVQDSPESEWRPAGRELVEV